MNVDSTSLRISSSFVASETAPGPRTHRPRRVLARVR
jgi:hypothetical protein